MFYSFVQVKVLIISLDGCEQAYDPQTGYEISYFRPTVDEHVRGQGLPSPQEVIYLLSLLLKSKVKAAKRNFDM